MLIAYFTTDEVNAWVAERLATECGMTLCVLFLSGGPAGEEFDALLFDWDFLPLPWREEALTMLTTRPLDCPVGVHSYHLPEKQIQALRAKGVQVRQRLQPTLFHELFRAMVQARPTLRKCSAMPATSDGRHDATIGPNKTPSALSR